MKKVERYFYPAIFTYEPDQEIAVDFPDLKCATSGVNDDDALLSARELLGIVMNGLEEDNEDIPIPTPLEKVSLAPLRPISFNTLSIFLCAHTTVFCLFFATIISACISSFYCALFTY